METVAGYAWYDATKWILIAMVIKVRQINIKKKKLIALQKTHVITFVMFGCVCVCVYVLKGKIFWIVCIRCFLESTFIIIIMTKKNQQMILVRIIFLKNDDSTWALIFFKNFCQVLQFRETRSFSKRSQWAPNILQSILNSVLTEFLSI